jgi:uncharacterized membrane protein
MESMAAILVLIRSSSNYNWPTSDQTQAAVQAALSAASVALARGTVHTIFTTRYARLYYTGPDGGIDYNEDDAPGTATSPTWPSPSG